MTVPCGCCPTHITRCKRNPLLTPCVLALAEVGVTSPVPNQSLIVANPNGFGIIGIAATADGNTAGGSYGGIASGGGDATNVVIEYRWNASVNKAIQIRLWNNGGGNVNDFDGIGTALVTLLDGVGATLWAGALVAGNGGAIFVTNMNGTAQANEINGVRVMRLSNITNLPGAAAPDILWRNIDLRLRYAATLTWTCGGQRVVTAYVEGLDDGLSVAGNVITHNNGPHTITFNSPIAFTGVITTASPASFSALAIQNGSTITVTGTAAKTFTVAYTFDDPAFGLPAFCMLCDDAPTWYDNSGAIVNVVDLIDCV